MTLATAAQIIAEGKLYKEQFDLDTDEQLTAFIEDRIERASAFLERQVTKETYESEDEKVNALLTEAEIYLTCARCYRTIRNLAATYDQQVLPPEHVDERAINEVVAHDYELKAAQLIAQFDGGAYLQMLRDQKFTPAGDQDKPAGLPWYFRSKGVSQED